MTQESESVRSVFISYSHADLQWLERLRVHLKPLPEASDLNVWDATKIQLGSQWLHEIRDAIDRASVAILLISAVVNFTTKAQRTQSALRKSS
jgi:hypothetical protein